MYRGMKQIMIIIILCMAILSTSSTVRAGFCEIYTGNDLYVRITREPSVCNDDLVEKMYACGYIIGIRQSFDGILFYPPTGVTNGQILDIIKKYLEDNPDIRHKAASLLVIQALQKAFPKK